ncbi:MAG: hypothetical protein E1N59_237 [Puniceicoccaceae bacterium 5H]|nr:MAG: hypothetical protein E1N59_237 [Puniceicoccaceae bacterium 5H]
MSDPGNIPSPRRSDEFPEQAAVWPSQLSRRKFLQVAGAGLTLASMSGCFKKPREEILPYVKQPEQVVPGNPNFYATTHNWRGYGRGILVESREGRPVKVEGNPDHASSQGATDAVMQASLLGLYDGQRLRAPHQNNHTSSWNAFDAAWLEQFQRLQAHQGRGLWVVAEPNSSPSELAAWQQLAQRFPQMRVMLEAPYTRLSLPQTDYRLEQADIIVGIDPDFLTEHPESLRYARAYAQRRRGWQEGVDVNRFYSLHAAPNVTNAQADTACVSAPGRWESVMDGLLGGGTGDLSKTERQWVEQTRRDLQSAGARALVIGGSYLSPVLQDKVQQLNRQLGNEGTTWVQHTPPPQTDAVLAEQRATSQELADALEAGEVEALLCLDANPGFYFGDLLVDAIAKAKWSACFALEAHETARQCTWKLPVHHFLEEWGDLRSFTGELSPVQPLIRPMYQSRARLEILHRLAQPSDPQPAYNLVRRHWQQRVSSRFEKWWSEGLQKGVFPEVASDFQGNPAPAVSRETSTPSGTGRLQLLVRLDPHIEDGRGARNAWLQELPKPMSMLVWDQALWLSIETAQEHGLEQGDVVELSSGDRRIQLPVYPMRAMDPGTMVAFMGYGRPTAQMHDGHATGYALEGFGARWFWPAVSLEKTGEHYDLVTTQHHQVMDGHDFARVRKTGEPAPEREEHRPPEETSFMPEPPKPPMGDAPYKWGMSIDLSSCIGCGACVTACQAENNIPVVGKEQVAVGREMLWIRIDRYFSEESGHTRILHQPVPCMQCEKAPCEVVCPVGATLHDSEGLNAMVYNRCIGTRYCSNNCPYKVRRFNFLDYRPPKEHPRNLQFNPEVTVRERGVMEKCTYCVQRISRARIDARNQNREIRDGEIVTACQQVCPTEAIVFGDISRPENHVSQRKAHEEDYQLLAELDTRPRTTYLPRWENPPHEDR